MRRLRPLLALFLVVASALLRADLVLPPVFSEHMVLQRSAQTPVWGRATPGEKVALDLGGVARADAVAGPDGRWNALLDLADVARVPAGPHTLTLKATDTVTIPDVLVGEVWLASGQSNMARTMKVCGSPEEIASSGNDRIRFFTTSNQTAFAPLADIPGKWEIAGPAATPRFSAVAWYFARRLQAELGLPVGILHASWGGTPIEAWISHDALAGNPLTAATAQTKIREAKINDPSNYPERKAEWLAAVKPWLAAHGREDRPTSAENFAAFAMSPASAGVDGWSATKVPGPLPGDGVVWVRRDFEFQSSTVGTSLVLSVDEIVGIDNVYLDGKRLGGRTLETYEGDGIGRQGVRRYYRVPAELTTAGRHTLAIRIYAPLGAAGINAWNFKAGSLDLEGDWLVKTELAFGPPTAAELPSFPGLLEAPRRLETTPSLLFNGMISGLIPYGLRGFIWYQGEGDAGLPQRYRTTFPLLIDDWRTRWTAGRGADAPPPSFYWCQLPNYQAKSANPNANPGWAGLREAQARALELPRTGQAVLIDAGEAGNLHPVNKRDAGARLAVLALARDYGKQIESSGPVFERMTVEGSAIRLRFTHLGGGLVARPVPDRYLQNSEDKLATKPLRRNSPKSQLEGFAIRGGAGQLWEWADAHIEGDTVVVSSPRIAKPTDVRYAWLNNPTCNLYNAAGLPAAPFRTDKD